MEVANIAPTTLLDKVIDEDEKYHLLLVEHVLHDSEYRQFYADRKAKGDFLILDNDAFEKGTSASLVDILGACALLRPHEVCLPDAMGITGARAYDMAALAIDKLRLLIETGYTSGFMAIPHGSSFNQFEVCARQMCSLPFVRTIGVINTQEAFDMDRTYAVKLLTDHLSIPGSKSIHLLGMEENMEDIQDEFVRQRCRGIDAGKLICWGLEGLTPKPGEVIPEYPGRPENYFDLTDVTDEQLSTIRENIKTWRDYAGNITPAELLRSEEGREEGLDEVGSGSEELQTEEPVSGQA